MTDIIPAPKANVILDISMYDTFRSCEFKYFLRYLKNKVSPDPVFALDRGTLVHLACEHYYEGLKNGQPYEDRVLKALSSVRSAGVETGLEVEDVLDVISVMESYFDHWKIEDQRFEVVEVEKPFLYLLHESDYYRLYLSGKIDLIISDNQYTNLPYDHKSYDRKYPVSRMSNQFKNYVNALDSNFLVVNRIGFQKTLKPVDKFLRVPLSFDPLFLKQWKDNVIFTMNHYMECMAEGHWPMNETSCDKFNRKCEYFDVCDSSGNDAKNYKIIQLLIDGEPWDVTKTLKRTSEIALEAKEKKSNGEEANSSTLEGG